MSDRSETHRRTPAIEGKAIAEKGIDFCLFFRKSVEGEVAERLASQSSSEFNAVKYEKKRNRYNCGSFVGILPATIGKECFCFADHQRSIKVVILCFFSENSIRGGGRKARLTEFGGRRPKRPAPIIPVEYEKKSHFTANIWDIFWPFEG